MCVTASALDRLRQDRPAVRVWISAKGRQLPLVAILCCLLRRRHRFLAAGSLARHRCPLDVSPALSPASSPQSDRHIVTVGPERLPPRVTAASPICTVPLGPRPDRGGRQRQMAALVAAVDTVEAAAHAKWTRRPMADGVGWAVAANFGKSVTVLRRLKF